VSHGRPVRRKPRGATIAGAGIIRCGACQPDQTASPIVEIFAIRSDRRRDFMRVHRWPPKCATARAVVVSRTASRRGVPLQRLARRSILQLHHGAERLEQAFQAARIRCSTEGPQTPSRRKAVTAVPASRLHGSRRAAPGNAPRPEDGRWRIPIALLMALAALASSSPSTSSVRSLSAPRQHFHGDIRHRGERPIGTGPAPCKGHSR